MKMMETLLRIPNPSLTETNLDQSKLSGLTCHTCKCNADGSNVDNVVSKVRFSLKTVEQLLSVVRLSGILDSDHLLDAITEKTASTQLPYRGALWPEENLVGSQTSAHWFHKVVWSPLDFGTATNPNGVIVGGCEGGVIQVYSALKLLGGENALMAQQDKHNGAVRSMDYNPYQNKLPKAQPFEDVQGLALYLRESPQESTHHQTDRHPIADPLARAVQWHPEVATQLWVASEEDQAPSVQLWDLRYATASTKTFHINQRGVLGLTWCPKDFDLVASCGKDNKIYCWNQNSEEQNGKILSELATKNQWNFDVAWCPRNPALIAGSSFDGNVTVYSTNGGAHAQVQTVVTNRELIERSNRLEQVLAEGTRSDACVRRNLKDCWETARLDCANYSDAGDI
ncbi:hypothetical protein pipiens_003125 [Culex pipiens pipiens]|uniref:Vesicle associated protein n=1 Tax=Culex pipiens pipiens TaxID=38569 RepID=A0ABD1D3F6_CULPP